MVVAQAVPSEVQSTVGSECSESPVRSGRAVWPQLAPPSAEKNWACRPFPMLFDAEMICFGLMKLIRMSDSLRGVSFTPEIFRFGPINGAAAALNSGAGEGCRS